MGAMPGVPPGIPAWSGFPKQEEKSDEDVINDNQKITKYKNLVLFDFIRKLREAITDAVELATKARYSESIEILYTAIGKVKHSKAGFFPGSSSYRSISGWKARKNEGDALFIDGLSSWNRGKIIFIKRQWKRFKKQKTGSFSGERPTRKKFKPVKGWFKAITDERNFLSGVLPLNNFVILFC